MERITRGMLERKLEVVGKLINLPTTAKLNPDRARGGNCWTNDFLSLDHAPLYGGYSLVLVHKETGGHSVLGLEYRLSPREMYSFLKGMEEALSLRIDHSKKEVLILSYC